MTNHLIYGLTASDAMYYRYYCGGDFSFVHQFTGERLTAGASGIWTAEVYLRNTIRKEVK